MRVTIKTKNFDLTPSLEILVEKKLIRLVEKLIGDLDQKMDLPFDIELDRTTKHHNKGKIWRAEAQLSLPGKKRMIRAEALAETINAAVGMVKYELLREIKKYKEKIRVQG